jgi:hypothetical protein
MKMLHDCRWTNPAAYHLSATEKLVYQWLLGNKDTTISGVYTVMTGAILDGVGYHIFDNNVKGSPAFPILDKLVDSGLIAYDKATHTLRLINYHKFRPFGSGNPLIVVNGLEKDFLALYNKDFFVDYVIENYDVINEKIAAAKIAYKKAMDGKGTKLTDPEKLINLQKILSKVSKMSRPDSEIIAKESSSLSKKNIQIEGKG